jgi:hypothetical protein
MTNKKLMVKISDYSRAKIEKRPFISYITIGIILGLSTFYVCGIKQEETKTTYLYNKLKYVESRKGEYLLMRDTRGDEKIYETLFKLRKAIKERKVDFICLKVGTTGFRYFKSFDFSYRSSLVSIENENKCD